MFRIKVSQIRMLHPSSGRRNFDVITQKKQKIPATNQNEHPSQTEYIAEVKTETIDTIKNALKSIVPASSKHRNSYKVN